VGKTQVSNVKMTNKRRKKKKRMSKSQAVVHACHPKLLRSLRSQFWVW
jgi:hypothetical protein